VNRTADRNQLGPSSARPTLEYLRHRGPSDVVAGDLSGIGMHGLVFAPFTGPRRPAVVLGHGYLQPVSRYAGTLRFLASWGFVAAAPATEGGILPSHSGLALDLSRTLDRLADAKLHNGRVTVDAKRLAVVGHGIGGGAAVLAAAARMPAVQATATIFASPTSPSAVAAAAGVTTPGLHLVGGADRIADQDSDGEALARAWGGPVQLRRIKRAGHLAVTEGRHFTSRLLGDQPSRSATATIRLLVTAFLLLHLDGQDQWADELSGKIGRTTLVDIAAANE
jgi:pimeloyl-ACP methyl ester carboxylesterase